MEQDANFHSGYVRARWRKIMRLWRFARYSQSTHQLPRWCFWSIIANLAGAGLVAGLFIHAQLRPSPTAGSASSSNADAHPGRLATFSGTDRPDTDALPLSDLPVHSPDIGPRHKLDYQDWLTLLEQEAIAAAQEDPEELTVLLGDSISLWFPPTLLPDGQSWLNQGISGEVSAGLLKRLDLIEETTPETILIMVGINDLIQGVRPQTLLANYPLILEELRDSHPQAQLVVQSILPHASEGATWEGAARLLEIPNADIRDVNASLEAIAQDYDAEYLDLYPLFSDANGNLRSELTTDGLHLNANGYLVWATALQMTVLDN